MRRGLYLFLGIMCLPWCFAADNVQEFTLSNKLKLIVKEDHRSPIVLSSIWYKVGGSYESDGLTGISHALEHMMFRGTRRYPSGEFDRLIAKAGGQQNAETTNDYTMFYQLLPKESLALSFELESDRMTQLLLKPEDFAREMQVVMEERRMRFENNPQALAYERFTAAAFVNSPYHHQTIGWMTDLQHMTVADLRRWYEAWYHPNNAVLVVVGDVKAADVFALAQKKFGGIPAKPLPVIKPQTEVLGLGPVRLDLHLPARLALLVIGYHTPTLATTKNTQSVYALDVLAYVLGGANSSRLDNLLVRQQQLATSVTADHEAFNLHGNLLQIMATPVAGVPMAKLEAAINAQIQRLKQEPITAAELARVKAQMLAGNIYRQDSVQEQAEMLGRAAVLGLPWSWALHYSDAIDHVTPADVQQAAQLFLRTAAMTTLVLHPQMNATDVRSVPHENKP